MEKKILGSHGFWAAALTLVTLVAAPLASAQSLAPKNQAAAVMVGHSLINFDMPEFVQALADSKGLAFTKAVQVMIGAPLRMNLAGCRRSTSGLGVDPGFFSFSCDAIEAGSPLGPYDTLILTDSNGTIAATRQYQRTDDAIADYMDIFLSRNPSGRVMLFTSWESTTTYGNAWPDFQARDLATYEEMARAATSIAASRGRNAAVSVIPVDIALRDLILLAERGEIPGITSRSQIFSDDVHMTAFGNYFVACVLFSAIFNQSPEGATRIVPGRYANTPPMVDVPSATASTVQRLAWTVVSTYRGATPAPRPKAPAALQVR